MWKHYCESEHCWISLEQGHACNWCGAGDLPSWQELQVRDYLDKLQRSAALAVQAAAEPEGASLRHR